MLMNITEIRSGTMAIHDDRNRTLPALAADLACVIAFAALGRRNHAEGVSIGGVAETAWPFLAGTVVGWLLSRGWRRPTALLPTGITVWVCTVVVGMLLRKATSEGAAMTFIAVTTLFTAVVLLGWRAALNRVARRSR
jgi:peptidoglycan/LPS O-acetylase OafA/YrhL